METDQPAVAVPPPHFRCRANHTAPPLGGRWTSGHHGEPLDGVPAAAGFQYSHRPDLVRTSGPVSWAGPRRRRKPGVRWEDLPPIDIVLLSHNHYDHLDLPTLRRLAARGDSTFIVPARMARLLRSQDLGPAHELDWGDSIALSGCTIHCVPALHFSSRGVFDRNRTLWCGYVIEWQERLVYFAGDTGFGSHFAQIREIFGPPDVALLPIGAYEPRWFMSPVHMAPDEAIRAHEILAARTSIAIHHGTFQLADEGIDAPAKQLIASAKRDSFLVLQNGQFADLP